MKSLDTAALLEELDALGEPRGVVAFDADGTLWRGDVGDDLFLAALEEGLSPLVEEPLRRWLTGAGVEAGGDAGQLAHAAFEAFQRGKLDVRATYEAMVWVHAGISPEHLAERARRALAGIPERLHVPVVEALEGARRRGHRILVVSASPRAAVLEGVRHLPVPAEDVIATEPRVSAGILTPELALPLPYGPEKARAVRAHASGAPLLAAFGDSLFDLELLLEARLGVAVRPKAALREALEARHPAARELAVE